MSRATPFNLRPLAADVPVLELFATGAAPALFVVSRSGPLQLTLRDESDRKYTVRLGAQSCSCARPGKPKRLCVHLVFVMLKVFKLPPDNALVWQHSLADNEIDQVLTFAARNRHSAAGSAAVESKQEHKSVIPIALADASAAAADGSVPRRPLTEDDNCPVCYEAMKEQTQALSFCRFSCGQNVHSKCMLVWARHRASVQEQITCPLCRHPWPDAAVIELREQLAKAEADERARKRHLAAKKRLKAEREAKLQQQQQQLLPGGGSAPLPSSAHGTLLRAGAGGLRALMAPGPSGAAFGGFAGSGMAGAADGGLSLSLAGVGVVGARSAGAAAAVSSGSAVGPATQQLRSPKSRGRIVSAEQARVADAHAFNDAAAAVAAVVYAAGSPHRHAAAADNARPAGADADCDMLQVAPAAASFAAGLDASAAFPPAALVRSEHTSAAGGRSSGRKRPAGQLARLPRRLAPLRPASHPAAAVAGMDDVVASGGKGAALPFAGMDPRISGSGQRRPHGRLQRGLALAVAPSAASAAAASVPQPAAGFATDDPAQRFGGHSTFGAPAAGNTAGAQRQRDLRARLHKPRAGWQRPLAPSQPG